MDDRQVHFVSMHRQKIRGSPIHACSSATMAAIGKPTEHGSSTYSSGGEDKMQTLKVWEPPAFSLAFFWSVSPVFFLPYMLAR